MNAVRELTDTPPVSDPPRRRLELDTGPLAYVDEGPPDAPAVVTAHGIPGSVRDFRHLAPLLAADLRVLRVDLPGFGQSPPVEAATVSLAGRARVLAELSDRLALDRPIVVGHSMGGGTALAWGAAAPDGLRGVVLISSVGLRAHRAVGLPPRVFRLLARLLAVPGLGRGLAAASRARYRQLGFPGAERLDATGLALQLRAIGALDFDFLRRCAGGPLPPVALAYARDDRFVETAVSEQLAAAIPAARVLAFDSGGHNIQKTRAPELAALIRELAHGPH